MGWGQEGTNEEARGPAHAPSMRGQEAMAEPEALLLPEPTPPSTERDAQHPGRLTQAGPAGPTSSLRRGCGDTEQGLRKPPGSRVQRRARRAHSFPLLVSSGRRGENVGKECLKSAFIWFSFFSTY